MKCTREMIEIYFQDLIGSLSEDEILRNKKLTKEVSRVFREISKGRYLRQRGIEC